MTANFKLTNSLIGSVVIHLILITYLGIGSQRVDVQSPRIVATILLAKFPIGHANANRKSTNADTQIRSYPNQLDAPPASNDRTQESAINESAEGYVMGVSTELPEYFSELESDRYWSASLDRQPSPHGLEPLGNAVDLPSNAIGSVVLVVLLSDTGVVEKVYLDTSQLPPEVTEKILQAMYFVRFAPGERQGQPVKSIMRMVLDFGFEREYVR